MDTIRNLLVACLVLQVQPLLAQTTAPSAAGTSTPLHCYKCQGEWVYEAHTANFRVFHKTSLAIACEAAQVAERTRSDMQRKWVADAARDWERKCDIYLYDTAEDYSGATDAPGNSPGHSSFWVEHGRVVGRQIDTHCDDPDMLVITLPHETTHCVVAGCCGQRQIPRWADEGMAVLSEPRAVERYQCLLPREREKRFDLQGLMEMADYPEPESLPVFYAQGVSLVEFLVSQRGARVFNQFLRDGVRSGYEPALRRYYGCRNFAELERRWSAYAFGEVARR